MGHRIEDHIEVRGGGAVGYAIRQFDDDCLAKVEVGEPIFVLRAQDVTAAETVEAWADNLTDRYREDGIEIPAALAEKLIEAYYQADRMRAWPRRKVPGQKFKEQGERVTTGKDR